MIQVPALKEIEGTYSPLWPQVLSKLGLGLALNSDLSLLPLLPVPNLELLLPFVFQTN